MVAQVAQGSAIASREICYDARELTDLLLRPATNVNTNSKSHANNKNGANKQGSTSDNVDTNSKVDTKQVSVNNNNNTTIKPQLVLST